MIHLSFKKCKKGTVAPQVAFSMNQTSTLMVVLFSCFISIKAVGGEQVNLQPGESIIVKKDTEMAVKCENTCSEVKLCYCQTYLNGADLYVTVMTSGNPPHRIELKNFRKREYGKGYLKICEDSITTHPSCK